jgi:eukaryotic-like serine/threonine-protein kinase
VPVHSKYTPTNQAAARADTEPAFELIPRKGKRAVAQAGSVHDDEFHPGDVIAGKYELVRLLGQGGMSAVWVVQNLVLDAQFALKLIHNYDNDEYAGERMLREARSVARLDHPAIIRMFDFGVTESGDPFLVMELLTGISLRERLRASGRMDPVEAVRLLLPVAEALSVAHAHGIVHRDLKPDNIVCVTAEGDRLQPKIIDFGIAKQVDEESRITQTGMVLGSPEYMSPEQALGLFDVDYRTDIWSFAVVLYEAVSGATPFFRAGDPAAVLRAVVDQPIPPLADLGIRDRELWFIISRGLQKTLDERWQDMHSFGEALARWLLHHGVEEDVCMQSVRSVWRGVNSPSAPPVAVDARHVVRAAPAALEEKFEVPKKSLTRTVLGVAAALVTFAFIAFAGLRFLRVQSGAAPGGTRTQGAQSEAPKPAATAPIVAPVVTDEHIPPPPPEVEAPATPVEASAAPAEETPPEQTAKERKAESSAAVARATSDRAAKERRSAEKKARRQAQEKALIKSEDPFTPEPEPAGTTQLPQLKPPPEFDTKPSDNPYRDDKPTTNTPSSDNPY